MASMESRLGDLETGTVVEQRSIIDNQVSDPQPPQSESIKQNMVGGAAPSSAETVALFLYSRPYPPIWAWLIQPGPPTLLHHKVHVGVVHSCGSLYLCCMFDVDAVFNCLCDSGE